MEAMGTLMKAEDEEEAVRQEEEVGGMGIRNYRTTIMFSGTHTHACHCIYSLHILTTYIYICADVCVWLMFSSSVCACKCVSRYISVCLYMCIHVFK